MRQLKPANERAIRNGEVMITLRVPVPLLDQIEEAQKRVEAQIQMPIARGAFLAKLLETGLTSWNRGES